jgi:DNA-binding SARP family transcriptional activator/tetratricopeptide (TPR) repeat protein
MPERQVTAAYRLKMFGRLSITTASGAELLVSAPRQQAMVAYLAMQAGYSCGRERLATVLWGESGDARARHSLSQAVLALKQKVGDNPVNFLAIDRSVLRLDEQAIEIDVRTFDRLLAVGDLPSLLQAIKLFDTGFLDDFNSSAPAFEEWAEAERARLWLVFRSAVEQVAMDEQAPADRVVEALTRLSNRDPFDEDVHRLMLHALARRFGSAAALGHAERFQKLLERELGVAPEPETVALVAQIRASPRVSTPRPPTPPAAPAAADEPASGPTARLFENVPPRDLNFTGRADVLVRLHAGLSDAGGAGAGRIAVHGLGGVGKTTVVAEYAYQHAGHYGGIWWARGTQRTLLTESLATLAVKLDPRLALEDNTTKAAIAGLAILSRSEMPFLLIYDDVSSPDVISDLIPTGRVSLIIMSRWPDWAGRAVELKLEGFDETGASEFLQKRAGRTDPPGAARLARALGLLPLALDHAGAYCRFSALSFDGYAKRIDQVIAHSPRGVTYPASIAATFSLALETAMEQTVAAETLLRQLAFLAPERIPLALVASDTLDAFELESAVAALYAVSLVDHELLDDGSVLLTLHPLVQSAMRFRLNNSGRTDDGLRRTAASLAAAFPPGALTHASVWPRCASLLRHALTFRELAAGAYVPDQSGGVLLSSLASYLHIRGAYGEAEQMYRESLAVAKIWLVADHPEIAAIEGDLALLLSTMGRYSEAEPLLREVIALGESRLGRRNIDVAVRINNLARLLSDTKRYEEAEPLYREAISIADEAKRDDLIYAVSWRSNLGILLNETGRNEAGEEIYKQALEIGLRAFGERHHEVARCMNNLGLLLRDVDRLAESEALIREALAIWADMLGEDHPIYARGQENLAKTLLPLGRLEEALAAAEAALRTHEAKLGAAHFWTHGSATSCVRALHGLGQEDAAKQLCVRFAIAYPPS